MESRDQIRARMWARRRGRSTENKTMCDGCGVNEAEHMHEIYARVRTMGNPEARAASFAEEICSAVCPKCHDQANDPAMRSKLIRFNIDLFGEDAVLKAFLQTNMRPAQARLWIEKALQNDESA